MTETERNQIKGALLKCAKENENKSTLTGHIVVSSLCKSAVERIEELEKELNKANEWHFPSKGEYPKECEDVLCYCKCRTEIKFCCVGHTIIGGDNKIRWWSSNRSEKLNVYAWKEITPPKEIKEE